jgi:hypothetical protein
MERDQETAGDYGYDLAHEGAGHGPVRGDTTGRRTSDAPSRAEPTGGAGEPSGDWSYDEAHGF